MKIGVLGFGNWGSAIAQHCAEKGHEVLIWDRDADVRQSITEFNRHPRFHQGIIFNEKISSVDTPEALGKQIAKLFIAIPSEALPTVALPSTLASTVPIISLIKGFVGEASLTPLQFLRSKFSNPLAVLSGPSFALDVMKGRPLGIVSASEDLAVAKSIAQLLSGRGMRVYPSKDALGVELGGAVKNVIAIAAGVSDGLGYGDSSRAGIITRGLAEMIRLAQACGASFETLCGLSGLGDLLMTSASPLSRNRTVGFQLGKGKALSDILASLESVAEGVVTAAKVLKLAQSKGIEMPISEQVVMLLSGEISAKKMEENLLYREMKAEF